MYFPKSIIPVFAILTLLGAFTLAVPVLLLISILLGILLFLAYSSRAQRFDKIFVLTILNYFYWLLSAFLVGSISPYDLLNPEIYSGEGRIFIYYLPLLIFIFLPVKLRYIESLVPVFKVFAIMSLVLFLIWRTTGLSAISGGRAGNLYGFMTSHHASGAMFSIIALMLIVNGLYKGNRQTLFLGVATLLPMFASASRSSVLGLLAVSLWYIARRQSFKTLLLSTLTLSLLLSTVPVVAPHMYERTVGILNTETIDDIVSTIGASNWEPGLEKEIEGTAQNVLSRALFWGYAYKKFIDSPFFGIGFGRWNDTDLEYEGRQGVSYVATEGNKRFSVGNAHNSYFHLLAESGVLGLILMLNLWRLIYVRLRRYQHMCREEPMSYGYYEACQGLMIFALTGSLFGHWMAAPAIGLPVMVLVGMALAYGKTLKLVASGRSIATQPLFAGEKNK